LKAGTKRREGGEASNKKQRKNWGDDKHKKTGISAQMGENTRAIELNHAPDKNRRRQKLVTPRKPAGRTLENSGRDSSMGNPRGHDDIREKPVKFF